MAKCNVTKHHPPLTVHTLRMLGRTHANKQAMGKRGGREGPVLLRAPNSRERSAVRPGKNSPSSIKISDQYLSTVTTNLTT